VTNSQSSMLSRLFPIGHLIIFLICCISAAAYVSGRKDDSSPAPGLMAYYDSRGSGQTTLAAQAQALGIPVVDLKS